MSTSVNSPPPNETNNGIWNFLSMLLLVAVVFVLIFYGLPYLRNYLGMMRTPQINVPGKIDVNIQQTK